MFQSIWRPVIFEFQSAVSWFDDVVRVREPKLFEVVNASLQYWFQVCCTRGNYFKFAASRLDDYRIVTEPTTISKLAFPGVLEIEARFRFHVFQLILFVAHHGICENMLCVHKVAHGVRASLRIRVSATRWCFLIPFVSCECIWILDPGSCQPTNQPTTPWSRSLPQALFC